MKQLLLLLTIVSLSLVCSGCVGQMFYYPDGKVYGTPAAHGLKYEEVTFFSKDGTRLSGWFVPAKGVAKGTVIHFHGNAQNMTSHFEFVSWLPAEGFNLFVFDYRGYGKSAGRPNRRGVYEDSVAAVAYVRSRKDLDQERLLLLGQSLGGAQAIVVAGSVEKRGIRAVAIDSAFYSYRSIVRDKIAAMPVLSWFKTPLAHLLIGDELSPADYVPKIAPVPLLLMHGTHDAVIPFSHGQHLLERAGQPKSLLRVEGGEHLDALAEQGSPYRKKLVSFFEQSLNPSLTARQ